MTTPRGRRVPDYVTDALTALRKSEARFTELFESLQEGIYIVTPDDRLVDVNPALARMLGYESKEELLSRSFADLLPDEGQRRALREEVDNQAMVQGREITLTRKDGRPLVCLNTAGAVRDTNGRVVRYHGALMDITERREMSTAVAFFAPQSAAVIASTPLPVHMSSTLAPATC